MHPDTPYRAKFAKQVEQFLRRDVVAQVLDEEGSAGTVSVIWSRRGGGRECVPVDFWSEFAAASTHSLATVL